MKLGYWARRAWHFLGAVFPLALLFFPQARSLLLWGIGLFFLLVLGGEITRFAFPPVNQWLMEKLRGVIKAEEGTRPTGTFFYLLSSWACIFFFSPLVAAAALLDVVFGDSAASWVGSRWGRKRWGPKNKSLEGSFACLVACGIINLILLPWGVALAGAIGATLVEAFFPWKDDNLTVPLGAGVIMELLRLKF
jgi:dolichol kinase